jgi:hypothetical protein
MATQGSVPPSQQARDHHMANLERAGGTAGPWAGWITFAATVLVLLGCLHVFQGFLALLDDGYFAARGEQLVLVSYDAWGAVLLLWGGFLLLVGAALNGRRGWARFIAIPIVMLDVIIQFGFFPSQPLLSLFLITLDVVVLFALTARWDEAQLG